MLANALTPQRKRTHRRRSARRSSVFGNALGNAAVRGLQNYGSQKPSTGAQTFGLGADAAPATVGELPPDAANAGGVSMGSGGQTVVVAMSGNGGGTSSRDQLITHLNGLFDASTQINSSINDAELNSLRDTYAIALGLKAAPAGATTLSNVEVTPDVNFNRDYMQVWSWATANGFQLPGGMSKQSDLNAYRNAMTQKLGPARQQWIASEYPASREQLAWQAKEQQIKSFRSAVANDPNWAIHDLMSGLGEMGIGGLKRLGEIAVTLPQEAWQHSSIGYLANAFAQGTLNPEANIWDPITYSNDLQKGGGTVLDALSFFVPGGELLEAGNAERAVFNGSKAIENWGGAAVRDASATADGANNGSSAFFDGLEMRGPQRALDQVPGSQLTADINNFVTVGKNGNFNDLPLGTPGDKSTTLLWTVDKNGVNFVPEQTAWDSSRGIPSHTNISNEAYFAGEAWRTADGTVTLNTGSRAFGYNWQTAGDLSGGDLTSYLTEMQARYDGSVQYMESLGLKVNPTPLGER